MIEARCVWRKDCECKVAGATINGLRFEVSHSGADSLTFTAVFTPGPACSACNKPWRLERSTVR